MIFCKTFVFATQSFMLPKVMVTTKLKIDIENKEQWH